MKNLKQLLISNPEYILIALVIFFWTLTTSTINLVAIGLISILILQIIFKNRITGLIIGCIFVFINLYLILAIGSELFEFPTFNSGAKRLLIYGFSIMGVTSIATGLMIYKHLLSDRNTASDKN